HRSCRRGDHKLYPIVGCINRRRPTVDGLIRIPGRKTIDLRTYNAFEIFSGTLGQLERAKQESGRSQNQFYAAATQDRRPILRQRLDDGTADYADAMVWQTRILDVT